MTTGTDAVTRAASAALFEAAQRVIPGGVNSPVRAYRSVGGAPPFVDHGRGALLVDADGNEYVDYVMSWGALPLGHAHPAVVQAVSQQAARGTSFGAPTALETELAQLLTQRVPSLELVRFVSSGTEAVMSAVRLARAATKRDVIVKFDGCYHGHADAMLAAAGSGVATLGISDSVGVTEGAIRDTVSLPFNDVDAVRELFRQRGREIAAVIVEPVAGNMGLVLPASGFLETLRAATREHGALLIFDEVMTGARVARGGAQSLFGITPDLTTMGKVIGGGLPVAAYGGRADLMQLVAPLGPVYQAGTLSGNPLAMAAGLATLRVLSEDAAYGKLDATSQALATGLRSLAHARGIALQSAAVGGMWGFFFSDAPVSDYASARRSNGEHFRRFFHACLEEGIYLPPSAYEACFVSLAHDEAIVERTLGAFGRALESVG